MMRKLLLVPVLAAVLLGGCVSDSFEGASPTAGPVDNVQSSPSGVWSISQSSEQAFDGTRSLRIETNGGGGCCSYGRATYEPPPRYGVGQPLGFGADFFIPDVSSVNAFSRLLSTTSWPNTPIQQFGAYVEPVEGQIRVQTQASGNVQVLCDPIPIPEGRWFNLAVWAPRLSPVDGEATTVCYLDGVEYDRSTQRNMFNTNAYGVIQGGFAFFCPTDNDCSVDAGTGDDAVIYIDRFFHHPE